MTKQSEQIEKLQKKIDYEHNKFHTGEFIAGMFASGIIIFIILLIFTNVFSGNIDKLHLDKNKISADYVLQYYPEFSNCSIIYNPCVNIDRNTCNEGVNIFCNQLDNRDGLVINENKTPTKSIIFANITLDDIFNKFIARYKK